MDAALSGKLLARFLGTGRKRGAPQLSADGWDALVEAAYRHGVVSLLFRYVTDADVASSPPRCVLRKMQLQYVATAARNRLLYDQLRRVLKSFNDRGISVIVLKGAHLAESVYANIALRPMADIDLLVRQESLQSAEQALLDVGYQPAESVCGRPKSWYLKNHFHFLYCHEDNPPIELHWDLRCSATAGLDLQAVWNHAQPCEIAGVNTLVMSQEDLVAYLCLHAALHHRFMLGVRPLCDISQVLAACRTEFDWNRLIATTREQRVAAPLYYTLSLAKNVLDTPISAEVLAEIAPDDDEPELLPILERYVLTLAHTDVVGCIGTIEKVVKEERWWATGASIFRALFPSLEQLRNIYDLPPRSKSAWKYYCFRPFDLFVRRGSDALQAVLRTTKWRSSMEKARAAAAIEEALNR